MCLIFYLSSCNTFKSNYNYEQWYSVEDTIYNSFEIIKYDTTLFQDYNILYLNELNSKLFYFVLVDRKKETKNFKVNSVINLKIIKLPCNQELKTQNRSKIDIIISSYEIILWINKRVVVDSYRILD